MEIYRTFVALPVRVSEKVRRVVEEMKGSLANERISWVDPGLYHITLRFIGDTSADRVRQIGEALGNQISSRQFRLSMTQPGSFGPRKRPRVVWIGFEQSPFISSLVEKTEGVLIGCGLPRSEQPFRAHLTLGRVRDLKDLARYYRTIAELQDRDLGDVSIDRLVYYRSVLGPAGPVYTPLSQIIFKE
jgi:2'-5' RNA ligase